MRCPDRATPRHAERFGPLVRPPPTRAVHRVPRSWTSTVCAACSAHCNLLQQIWHGYPAARKAGTMSGLEKFALTGKHAVITGASRGIGYAIAEAFLGAGARVTLTGRDT